jgi:hypothetical protein
MQHEKPGRIAEFGAQRPAVAPARLRDHGPICRHITGLVDVVPQLRRFADIGATEFTAIPLGDNATQARTVEVPAANRELT